MDDSVLSGVDGLADVVDEIKTRAKRARREAVEVGARVEARWDGRDFDGLSRTERQRYMDRFEAAMDACNQHIVEAFVGVKLDQTPAHGGEVH